MMQTTRQPGLLLLLSLGLAIVASSLSPLALAAEEDVSQNDPPRWYQADDTPQLHYKNLLKEASAAYAQSLQECKTRIGAEAKNCRDEARMNYAGDKERAKRILKLLDHQ